MRISDWIQTCALPICSFCIDLFSSTFEATKRRNLRDGAKPRSASVSMVSSSIARNAAVEEKSMTVGGTGTTRAFDERNTDKDMTPRAGGGYRTMTKTREGRVEGKRVEVRVDVGG